MASAKQDFREATSLVFFEVCMDSITKNSTYGDEEMAIFNRIYRTLTRAWVPINKRQAVDPRMLLQRHKRLAMALQMVWGPVGTPVNGKTILCGLMELGERVWSTARLETRKEWDELIRLTMDVFGTAEEARNDALAVERGETLADIVDGVAFQGQEPAWAVKVALSREAARLERLGLNHEELQEVDCVRSGEEGEGNTSPV